MKKSLLNTFIVLFLPLLANSQQLLKDIRTDNGNSDPRYMVEVNGKHLFIGTYDYYSTLFTTDGTYGGTHFVKDPFDTSGGGPLFDENVIQMVSLGNKSVFVAYNPLTSNGRELWVSDGTSTGTFMLKDIYSGGISSNIRSLTKFGSKALFVADDGISSGQVWVTDGTETGTFKLLDATSPSGGSNYLNSNFFIADTKAYYFFYTPEYGNELYVTDGTSPGTKMVADYASGTASTYTYNPPVIMGNTIYFVSNNRLLSSDGSGVNEVFMFSSSGGFGEMIQQGSKLVFSYYNYSNNTSNLAVISGTGGSVQVIKSINSANTNIFRFFTLVGSQVFFSAGEGINGIELWKTDGTTPGTQMVKDINLTSTGYDNYTFSGNSRNRAFIPLANNLIFLANSGPEGFELWGSNGTAGGTQLIKDSEPGPRSARYSNFFKAGNYLYFTTTDSNNEKKTWQLNGTTLEVLEYVSLTPDLEVSEFYPLNNLGSDNFYFTAYNMATGYELYKGNSLGFNLVKDINQIVPSSSRLNLETRAVYKDYLYFTANDGKNGTCLWRTDGQSSGTELFFDLTDESFSSSSGVGNFYSGYSSYRQLITYKGLLYIWVNNRVYVTDGTAAPSQIPSNNSINVYQNLIVLGDNLYWVSSNKLIKYDGLTVTEVFSASSSLSNLKVAGDRIVFTFYSSAYGTEMYSYDPITSTTSLLADITSGTNSTSFITYNNSFGVTFKNELYFPVVSNSNTRSLWRTNGTSAGTVKVKDFSSSNYDFIRGFYNHKDSLLVFGAHTSTFGAELWKTTGTEAGTVMIQDLYPGNTSGINSLTNNAVFYKGKLYFGGYSNATGDAIFSTNFSTISVVSPHIYARNFIEYDSLMFFGGEYYSSPYLGTELMKSDGTVAGTSRVKDIFPGSSSSGPSNFVVFDNKLFFVANNGLNGHEVWVYGGCPIDLVLSSSLNEEKVFSASNSITGITANRIESTSKVTYDAGKYVLLFPGFEAMEGAVFTAKIGGCSEGVSSSVTESVLSKNRTSDVSIPDLEYFKQYGTPGEWLSEIKLIEKQTSLSNTAIFDLKTELNQLLSKGGENGKMLQFEQEVQRLQSRIYDAEIEANSSSYTISPLYNNKDKVIGYLLSFNSNGQAYSVMVED